MASSERANWQSTKKTVLGRSRHMFNNPFMSDVQFTSKDSMKSFYAHKYMLATSSEVFYAMFYGELAETKPVIHLSDASEESIEEFLRFIYTDDCDLSADNVSNVLYLSKKYIMPFLTEKCVNFMHSCLNPENVLTILEQAITFDEGELELKCWNLVQDDIAEVIGTEEFNNISQQTMACLLKRDVLNIPEVDLFQAVIRWCDQQCSKKQMEVSRTNRRAVLKDAVYDIAFLSMSQEDFAKEDFSRLLSDQEMGTILRKFSGMELSEIKWKKRRQKSVLDSILRVARFKNGCINNPGFHGWVYEGEADIIEFSVNKNVLLHGVRLFGDKKGSEYEVVLELDGCLLVYGTFTSSIDKHGIHGYDVIFPKPVTIETGKRVQIAAEISGNRSCWGANGEADVVSEKITVSFYQPSDSNSSGTNVSIGQFCELLLSD